MTQYTQITTNDDDFTITVYNNGGRVNTAGLTDIEVIIGSNTFTYLLDPTVVSFNTTGEITLKLGNSVSAGVYDVVISLFDATSVSGIIVVHPCLDNSNLKLTVKEK